MSTTERLPDAAAGRLRVLVVDDEPAMRAMIRATLAPLGYDVVEASDGDEGVAVARASLPALVVSDVQVPGLDGLGLCRVLKRDGETANIPVLLVAGHADLAGRARAVGADGAVGKPFSPALLARRVAALVAERAPGPVADHGTAGGAPA